MILIGIKIKMMHRSYVLISVMQIPAVHCIWFVQVEFEGHSYLPKGFL